MPSKFAFRFATSIGSMAIAWSGAKIIATRLPDTSVDTLLQSLRQHCGEDLEWNDAPPTFVKALAAQVQTHLNGVPQEFPLEVLDLEPISPFFRRVYESLHAVPTGTALTYGELATAAGSPKASRAVGQAMARNPFPLVIPCHRVLGGGAKLVGFSAPGGIDTKARLLEIESPQR